MLLTAIDHIGDWNAQLFRELKGRLTRRNILVAVSLSVLGQLLLLGSVSERHCSVPIDLGLGGCSDPYWTIDWQHLFIVIGYILPFILFTSGVYVLISDLTQEERRGTLNFIRLSPHSSQRILLGKLLGVPVLIYLGIALAVPLHWWSAIAAGIPLGWVLACYVLIGAGCAFFYSAALLNTLLTQAQYQAISGSVIACWIGFSYIGLLASHFNWEKLHYQGLGNWYWFVFPVGSHLGLGTIWMLMTITLATYWVWQSINRRFRNPYATLLSKQQSYWLVGSLEIWLLGFFWPIPSFQNGKETLFLCLFIVSILTLVLFLAIMGAISPQRQALLDWSRYHINSDRVNGKRTMLPIAWENLIFGEKSPAPVAIAVNLAITVAIWLPWLLLFPVGVDDKIRAIVGLLLNANLIWIYANLSQLILLMKTRKRGIVAIGALGLAIFLPPSLLAILFAESQKVLCLWISFVFGSTWFVFQQASAMTIFLGLMGQFIVMAGLSLQLKRQLNRAGESASKPLLTGA